MHDRSLLGPADIDDADLTGTVGRLLGVGVEDLEVLDSVAEEFPYELPAITTAGRHWVHGTAQVREHGTVPWRMFVKQVQCWSRHPFFEFVPEEAREMAAAMLPWRTEAQAYAGALREALPDGLSMPRALRVADLDDLSAAVWLEPVPVVQVTWDDDRFRHVARLLGRFAASAGVRQAAVSDGHGMTIENYVRGRLAIQILPALRDPALWQHSLVTHAFEDDLRDGLLEVADSVDALADELMALPRLASHGDACPNNLLADGGPDVVMIDFGFFGLGPVGYDLGQLLVGDVQVGHRAAATLAHTEEVVLPAYVEGLADEGLALTPDVVRRAHAAQLMIFTGLSTVPLELLDGPIDDTARHVARERAAIARFCLDLLDSSR